MTPSPASPDAKGLSKEHIEQIKAVAVDFFRWFWNTPGTNADQGFDEWAGGPGQVALSALSAQERAEPAATLDIFDGRSTTYLEDGAFKLPDGKHTLYAASPPVAVRVKPLEWQVLDNGSAWARSPLGLTYQALPSGLWLMRNGNPVKAGDNLDAAIAAAQADYERRILAALDTPASSVVDEVMVERAAAIDPRVIDRIPDETLRHIANSKDTGACRQRIKTAILAALTKGEPT